MSQMTSPRKIKKPRLNSMVEKAKHAVQYNPNLRPATFPTLEWPQTFDANVNTPSNDHKPKTQAFITGVPSTLSTLPPSQPESTTLSLPLRLSSSTDDQVHGVGSLVSHGNSLRETDNNMSSSFPKRFPTCKLVSSSKPSVQRVVDTSILDLNHHTNALSRTESHRQSTC